MIKCRVAVKRFLILLLIPVSVSLYAETVTLIPRFSYYTGKKGEVLFSPGELGKHFPVTLTLTSEDFVLADTLLEGPDIATPFVIPFSIEGFDKGENQIDARLLFTGGQEIDTAFILIKLPPKRNGVRVDRLTGVLVVEDLPYVPFGFYNYWPVQPTLAEEEVVRGFNMISPYQRIERKSFRKRKKYMDRCAELGMKVHYNLLSVSGGGGVGSGRLHGLTEEEKRERLIREVLAMKDHPALLAWYIADEPVGMGMPPGPLEETYKLIKELDPYHPVSMVFMAPDQAWRYRNAMDIVMADPYPVPNRTVEEAGVTIQRLTRTFYPEKPVWLVPQAFGGNEWWPREPTPGEVRVMTYLGIINGATGIQYFVRHGMNGFPKSVQTWNECGSMAMETAELTPYYAAARPVRLRTSGNIEASGWKSGHSLLVVCVNPVNEPGTFSVHIPETFIASEAELPFENRIIQVKDQSIRDIIDGMDTRIYLLTSDSKPDIHVDSLNQVVDPGFEFLPVAGIPSATYFRVGKDRGATALVDSRVHHSGKHALRMVCPADGKGGAVSFYPLQVEFGKTYRFSFWAKAAPNDSLWRTKGFFYHLFHKKPGPVKCLLELGSLADSTYLLTNDWKRYDLPLIVNDPANAVSRIVPRIELDSRGTAWFDDLRFIQVLEIISQVAEPGKSLNVEIKKNSPSGEVYFSLDGSLPRPGANEYTHPITTDSSITFTAALWQNEKMTGNIMRKFVIHKGLGHNIELTYPPEPRYPDETSATLLDGQMALPAYRDKRWHNFRQLDLDALIDMDSLQEISQIEVTFLQQVHLWILYPQEVVFSVSSDGKDFREVYSWKPSEPSHNPGPEILNVSWEGKETARYVRVFARNVGICPEWSDGAGEKAWMYVDEIRIY